MGLIKQHLLKESEKEKKDNHYLNQLNKVNSRGTITFDEWKESGRFIGRYAFMDENPDENLHVDCTDIVEYYGGVYIQVLKGGEFYLEPKKSSKSLDEVEKMLWSKECEKFWG